MKMMMPCMNSFDTRSYVWGGMLRLGLYCSSERKNIVHIFHLSICWLLCLLCLSPCLCLACDERWWRRRAVIAGNLVHYQLIIKPGQMSRRCCPVATSVPPCSTSTQTLLDLSKIRHTALIYLTTWICWNICNDGEVSMTGVSKILTI